MLDELNKHPVYIHIHLATRRWSFPTFHSQCIANRCSLPTADDKSKLPQIPLVDRRSAMHVIKAKRADAVLYTEHLYMKSERFASGFGIEEIEATH